MITRVLIANRGEIALRIMRTCRAMGIGTVAVYSEADAAAPHVSAADQALLIGPAPATESYLDISRVIDAARRSGADAIHPGYGFLSEDPALSRACEDAGIIFIGPPASVMKAMGSKTGARALVAAAGVPVVPGAVPQSQTDLDIAAAVESVGRPAMLKAASGGGGKGMRVVREGDNVLDAIAAAKQESLRAFGRNDLYVEREIQRPRHIEVQIFGDRHGSVVHLFERDCTLQRRHQKVVEETPAPAISDTLRERLRAAAVTVARTVGYVNAGTVEFIVDGAEQDAGGDATFFFLELNMRLQVEHPVTEAITGLDLVRWQLLVASGERLPLEQGDITLDGHAIECRVYAEDPRRLLPQSGRLLRYREPSGEGIRIDSGVVEGQAITVHYDPLLAKVIAHGATREDARLRLLGALGRYEILGLHHNIAFLRALLMHDDVVRTRTYTRFIEDHLPQLAAPPPADIEHAAAAIAAFVAGSEPPGPSDDASQPGRDPWDVLRDGPLNPRTSEPQNLRTVEP